jgi:hypothetical protein
VCCTRKFRVCASAQHSQHTLKYPSSFSPSFAADAAKSPTAGDATMNITDVSATQGKTQVSECPRNNCFCHKEELGIDVEVMKEGF